MPFCIWEKLKHCLFSILLPFKMSTPTFNIALIGSGGVGKTSLIRLLSGGSFQPYYNPTTGIVTTSFLVHTAQGPFTLNILDYAGQEIFESRNSYNADLSIIMYDLGSKLSYKLATSFWKDFAGQSFTLYIANKNDLKDKYVLTNDLAISCKNINTPRIFFSAIIRSLANTEYLSHILL